MLYYEFAMLHCEEMTSWFSNKNLFNIQQFYDLVAQFLYHLI